MIILHIYCVQRIGPANPHWAIYSFKAIVHHHNQVIIYVKNAFLIHIAAGDNGVGAVDSRLGQTGPAVSPCNTESVSSVHIKVSVSGQCDKGGCNQGSHRSPKVLNVTECY